MDAGRFEHAVLDALVGEAEHLERDLDRDQGDCACRILRQYVM